MSVMSVVYYLTVVTASLVFIVGVAVVFVAMLSEMAGLPPAIARRGRRRRRE